MKTNRFEQGIVSVINIVGMGVLLYVGFYLGTKLAKKMKLESKKEVGKYKGIGFSAKKIGSDHLGIENLIV